MKVVDSSGWVEFLSDGPLAGEYSRYLEEPERVLTPAIVLFEVYKWVKRERGEEEALLVAAQLQKTEIVPLNSIIALTAADASLEHGLAMADAVVYATAATHEAELVTSDRDFATLPGVSYLEK